MKPDGFDPGETRATRISRFTARHLCGQEKGLTLSATAWDRQLYYVRWRIIRVGLDAVCRVLKRETHHCRNAYAREMLRYYLDVELEQGRQQIASVSAIYSMSALTNIHDEEEKGNVGHHR